MARRSMGRLLRVGGLPLVMAKKERTGTGRLRSKKMDCVNNCTVRDVTL